MEVPWTKKPAKQTNKQITNKQTSTYNITSNKVNKWTNTLTKTQSERWTDRNQITDRRLTHYQDQPTVTNCYSHVFSFFHHLLLSVSSIRSKDEVCLLSIYLSVLYICLFIYMLSDHLSVCSAHHILFICSICLLLAFLPWFFNVYIVSQRMRANWAERSPL